MRLRVASSVAVIAVAALVVALCTSLAAGVPSATYGGGAIPVKATVHVGLVGFSGDGPGGVTLDSTDVERALESALPTVVPSVLETRRPLNVEYEIDYQVTILPITVLAEVEERVADALVYDPGLGDADAVAATGHAFTVDPERAVDVSEFFDEIASRWVVENPTEHGVYTLLFVNPDKTRMAPASPDADEEDGAAGRNAERLTGDRHDGGGERLDGSDYIYRYAFDGSGHTQAFLTAGGVAVIDLSAGPCQFGNADVGEGTVSASTFPDVAAIMRDRRSGSADYKQFWLVSHMASLVTSAVRHLFVPDVRFETVHPAQKVMVPIIVLRNHNKFDPIRPDDGAAPYAVNVSAIREQLEGMLLPSQQLVLVTGTHALHEHRTIALALRKAVKADSVHELNDAGHYETLSRSYIDSEALLWEMKETADFLASGLISSSPLSRVFYNPEVPTNLDYSTRADERPAGTAIVPVYVLSLSGMPSDLLFDMTSQVHAAQDAVVVLQTDHSYLRLPYFLDGKAMAVDGHDVTRHIVEGLASALGGLVPPTIRYSPMHGELREDFTWGVGHHPFSPFSATPALSVLHTDTILRNAVLTQMDSAVALARQVVRDVDDFARAFLYEPDAKAKEQMGGGGGGGEDTVWVDRLYSYRYSNHVVGSPFARATVNRLHDELVRLNAQFTKVSDLLSRGDFEAAFGETGPLLAAARGFASYAAEELQRAETDVACCTIVHDVPHGYSFVFYIVIILFFGIMAFAVGMLTRPTRGGRKGRVQ